MKYWCFGICIVVIARIWF